MTLHDQLAWVERRLALHRWLLAFSVIVWGASILGAGLLFTVVMPVLRPVFSLSAAVEAVTIGGVSIELLVVTLLTLNVALNRRRLLKLRAQLAQALPLEPDP